MAMSVAAPPEPPLLRARDSVKDDTNEALIKEAKQRARRRRWSYGGAVVVVAVAAVAAFTIPGSPSSPRHAARPVRPAPSIAPLVKGPDAGSTLLASWGKLGVGYAFVYADGRVVWNPDAGVFLDADRRVTGTGNGCCVPGDATALHGASEPRSEFVAVERFLTAHGVELVLAGKLHPKRFLVTREVDREGRISIQYGTIERKGLWAEPTARVYEPTKYAIQFPWLKGDADRVVDQLPAPAQAILRGKQRTYDPSIGAASWSSGQWQLIEAFEVTAAELTTLGQIFGVDPASFTSLAIYPHGQPVPYPTGG
jgi:hypothetical protein